MLFCDYAKIMIESGAGGDGCISFRREKNIPFGGPDGGMGGRGGCVYVVGSRDLNTLIDFRYRPHYRAKRGGNGQGRLKAGAKGDDLTLSVPLGTEIWADHELVDDIVTPDRPVLLAKGGLGGRGNASFASSTNRAPREFTPGEPGVSLSLELKLKVLADIGLIGLPNAGKSTLLAALTSAQPKIGAYPFTTLTPQLGLMILPTYEECLLADLPGLVEGAHTGKGLGHRFLGHGERCRVLVHVLDGSSPTMLQDYAIVRHELESYQASLAHRPEQVVITKADQLSPENLAKVTKESAHLNPIIVSAKTGDGMDALPSLLYAFLKKAV